MAKKIFARAHVVKKGRWHIDFTTFDPETGQELRQRKDFGLNEIEDLAVRAATAACLVANIESFVAPRPKKMDAVTLQSAIAQSVAIKLKLPRANSTKQYITTSKSLIAWAEANALLQIPIHAFSRKHARSYWDHLLERAIRGRSRRNYLAALRALWSEMIEREMVTENPWLRIKMPRAEEKTRRIFTDQERRTVAEYAEKTNYWIFRGILIQFFCYIRPVEMTRLRFRDFDLGRGLVTVTEGNAKSWKKRIKTIPASIMHYFRDGRFDKYPANYFVFGREGDARRGRMAPSTTPIHENRMYKTHQKMLVKLKEAGLLHDISGLQWYSWKDTGISIHTRKTSPVATKDQAGHENLAITSIYYHSETVNAEYQRLENDLFTINTSV